MEELKKDTRKNFMNRKLKHISSILGVIACLAQFSEPLQKREDYAVSLRKLKNKAIIEHKRRKVMHDKFPVDSMNDGSQQAG